MAQQTAEVLRKARGFVARGWCQGADARTAMGEAVSVFYPMADQFCAAGAIERATDAGERSQSALQAFSRATGGWSVTGYNDSPNATQAEILAAFDRAIAAEEAS